MGEGDSWLSRSSNSKGFPVTWLRFTECCSIFHISHWFEAGLADSIYFFTGALSASDLLHFPQNDCMGNNAISDSMDHSGGSRGGAQPACAPPPPFRVPKTKKMTTFRPKYGIEWVIWGPNCQNFPGEHAPGPLEHKSASSDLYNFLKKRRPRLSFPGSTTGSDQLLGALPWPSSVRLSWSGLRLDCRYVLH